MIHRAVIVAAFLGMASAQPNPICSSDLSLCKNNPIEVSYTGEVCVCKCSNGWVTPKGATGSEEPIESGKGCTECPVNYGGSNCDQCAEGYYGTFPTCEVCRERVHCSDHADSMGGGSGQCKCDCRNHWDEEVGDKYECGHCPEEYDETTDCASCAQDRLEDASCTKCTSQTHCNDHASAAAPNVARSACTCTCKNKWEGDSCKDCPVGWDEIMDCDRCKTTNYGTNCENTCDLTADCSNHAHIVVVKSDGSGCECQCDEEWNDGNDCRECGPLAINNAGGCKLCKGSEFCNNHAKAAKTVGGEDLYEADSTHTTCKCDCRNKWEDANCGTCPEEYEETEGDCDLCTDVSYGEGSNCKKCVIDDCGGAQVALTCGSNSESGKRKGPSQARLVCQCKTGFESEGGAWGGHAGWFYGACNKCTSKAVGSPPNCGLCSAATSITVVDTPSSPQCYGHEKEVNANGARDACVCKCNDGYNNDNGNAGQCDGCKNGYYREQDLPQAECKLCSVHDHCNSHASRVDSNSDRLSCRCTCESAWEGDACETCDTTRYEMGTAKPFCDKCKTGHINFGPPQDANSCVKCEVGNDCGGRANSVTTNTAQTKCECDCFTKYEGDMCERCAEGYIGFPDCRECTIAGDCVAANTESVTSSGDRNTCQCTCKKGFAGPRCDECDEGHINYDTCTECTSAAHCNNRASGEHFDGTPAKVETDGGKTKCVCTCKNKYEGETCDTCPAEYEGDCDKCVNGGIYPECGQCTIAEHCTGHADKVEAAPGNTGCICTCTPPWKGEKCDECESPWDPATGCTKCIPGYVPDATGNSCRMCSITDDCNDNSDEVDSDGLTCECKAKDPDEYCTAGANGIERQQDGSCKCGTGQPGYTGVCPCGDVSASPYYCWHYGGHCRGMWGGANCGTCNQRYNATRGCGYCNNGYVGFPRCRECNQNSDCGSRAVAVESDEDNTYCRCSCQAGFRWEWGVGCYFCAPGYADKNQKWRHQNYISAPISAPIEYHQPSRTVTPTQTYVGLCDPYRCSIQDDCAGNARAVYSDEGFLNCMCDCFDNFESPHWYFHYGEYSPAPHYSTQCDGCAPGHIDLPDCKKCNDVEHCSSHSVNVTDDGTRSKCVCTCYGQYTGDQCETCPPEYGGKDCDECAKGRIGYPACVECNVIQHCNDHALSVTSNEDNTKCVCDCRNKWTDVYRTCADCPPQYDSNEDCGKCKGGAGYPTCGQACSVENNCNNQGYDVECEGPGCEGSGNFSCKCSCFEGFEPESCSGCLPGKTGNLCDICMQGWEEMDDGSCVECTNDVSCNGRAESVTSFRDRETQKQKCMCSCKGFYEGEMCEKCPDQYGGAEEESRGGACDKCATSGYNAYTGTAPNCQKCDRSMCVEENIEGMEVVNGVCQCVCAGAYEEDNCGACDAEMYGPKCDRCATGLAMFPECTKCNVEEHCFDYADAVEEDEGGIYCNCKCDSDWCANYGNCQVKSNMFAHNARRIMREFTSTPTETISCRAIIEAGRGIVPPGGRGMSRTQTLTLIPARILPAAPDEDDNSSGIAAGVIIGLSVCCCLLGAFLWRRKRDKEVESNLEDFETKASLQAEMMQDQEDSSGEKESLEQSRATAAADADAGEDEDRLDV